MGGAKSIVQSALVASMGRSNRTAGFAAAAHIRECDDFVQNATLVSMASESNPVSSVRHAHMGALPTLVKIAMVVCMAE